jgi:hypothetical protein
MYQASIPALISMLGNLSKILDKAAAFTEARKIEPSVLITDRLAPDMLPLARQVQIASDMAVRGAARLAEVEFPSLPDTETTFPELQNRIAKTVEFLETLTAQQIDRDENRQVTVKMRDGEMTFTAQAYLLNFVLPNFYFHVTATYLILRHNGVELGKKDFLGSR